MSALQLNRSPTGGGPYLSAIDGAWDVLPHCLEHHQIEGMTDGAVHWSSQGVGAPAL